jgi:hypothetical protein
VAFEEIERVVNGEEIVAWCFLEPDSEPTVHLWRSRSPIGETAFSF